MHARRHLTTAAFAVTAASALCVSGIANASITRPGHGARTVLASTAPAAPAAGHAAALAALPAASRVRVSVFVGRDQAGLAALARAGSDPASSSYEHYLSPAQVQAEFGATAAQQRAVSGWLSQSGLAVTHRDPFVVSATGTAARASAALRAGLELSRPKGGTEQVVSSRAMSVPAAIAGAISTVRGAPQAAPRGQPEPMKMAAGSAGSKAGPKVQEACSGYYGQKKATDVPSAYGKTLSWAPCGYLPQ